MFVTPEIEVIRRRHPHVQGMKLRDSSHPIQRRCHLGTLLLAHESPTSPACTLMGIAERIPYEGDAYLNQLNHYDRS